MTKKSGSKLNIIIKCHFFALACLILTAPSFAKNKKTKKETKKFHSFDEKVMQSKYSSWGIDPKLTETSINLTGAWKSFKQKKKVVVAVIDTGVDPSHPFLRGNLYVPHGKSSSKKFGLDFSKSNTNRNTPFDSHGHGTHVAGIIKSVFPTVKLLVLKYYNPSASGQDNLNSTISALKYAVDLGVDIINYSGGGPEPSLEELKILKEAERKGILVVAAAGNDQNNIDFSRNAYYPASYGLKNIITVTTHDRKLRVLPSSNYGNKSVDISAPGHRIKSALPFDRAGYLTGTSQSTAFVSGVAALIMSSFPSATATDVKQVINASAKVIDTLKGKCKTSGKLDATSALKLARLKVRTKAGRKLANRYPNSVIRSSKIIYRLLPNKYSAKN